MTKSRKLSILKGMILTLAVLLAGCGYSVVGDNPPLPKGAESLGLYPVQNQTFVPDLEIRLNAQLKEMFRGNTSMRLVPPARAELRLSIRLKELKNLTSGLDILQEAGGVNDALKGAVELEERLTGATLWQEENLSVELTESRSEALNYTNQDPTSSSLIELTALFARRVYERIFVEF